MLEPKEKPTNFLSANFCFALVRIFVSHSANFRIVRIFALCEFSHGANFRTMKNFRTGANFRTMQNFRTVRIFALNSNPILFRS